MPEESSHLLCSTMNLLWAVATILLVTVRLNSTNVIKSSCSENGCISSYKIYPSGASSNIDWWQSTVVYQIYPRSFSDSNGDGLGDLKGIENKLDHFKSIGVETIWISPFFKSPMADFGYDISDFRDIDPIFGTMEDFDSLLKTVKQKGLKLILDLVPNHSSDQHDWFNKSRYRVDPYTDYYVWKDGKGPDKKEPPNNWLAAFKGSAWTYDEVRGQFYFHQFLKEQPDFNYENPQVREEMRDIMRFWLDKGIDGFRVDAYTTAFEDQRFLDEPLSNDPDALPGEHDYLNHIYTLNQPKCYEMLAEWQELLKEYEKKDGHHRLIMLEIYDFPNVTSTYYGNSTTHLSDFPFNFQLIKVNKVSSPRDALALITDWLDFTPEGRWNNWVLGNHDRPRVSSRVNLNLKDGLNMISLLLPGTAVTYYGEEIGMEDIEISWEDTQDPAGCNAGPERYKKFSRDPERSPMQWNTQSNAGFSTAKKTWLPIHDNYKTINVETQSSLSRSHLQVYKDLVALRKDATIQKGSVQFPLVTDNLFTLLRMLDGNPAYLVVVNWSNEEQQVDLSDANVSGFRFPLEGKAVALSTNIPDDSPFVNDGDISLTNLILGPYQSVVISFYPIIEKQK